MVLCEEFGAVGSCAGVTNVSLIAGPTNVGPTTDRPTNALPRTATVTLSARRAKRRAVWLAISRASAAEPARAVMLMTTLFADEVAETCWESWDGVIARCRSAITPRKTAGLSTSDAYDGVSCWASWAAEKAVW